ncbi:MAG: stage II sporulation protein M [Acidimicrobiales bacterium]
MGIRSDVDVDAFITANQPAWDRLGVLTTKAGRSPGRLSAAELDELVRLYQRVSTHLSYVRTYQRDPALSATLTRLVARAGAVVYGTRSRTLRSAGRFVTETFPAALWQIRRFVAVAALLLFLPALAMGIWVANSDAALEASAPPAVRQAYVDRNFEDYYSSAPAAAFASQVFTNNVRVGFLAFAGGIAFCVVTALILATNGASIGVAGGTFAAAGQSARFWGLILPHGLLELAAVCIAGGAGLALGWALIDPGDRSRSVALAEEARRSVVVVMGLVGVFGVAGLIEGFVTGSGMPTWLRVGTGVVAFAAFAAYAVTAGRAAAARGLTGTLGEEPLPSA